MNTILLSQINTNDIVTTKKNHPCGGNKWKIISTGAEFKLQCLNCNHTVILSGETLKKSVKSISKPISDDQEV